MKNIKKILGVFVIMACALLMIPNNVSAEEMSDTFKKLLNEDGKLVVTDTTMAEDKQQFLYEYLQKYGEDGYGFYINQKYDETHYSIALQEDITGNNEVHDVEIVFEETFSTNFKKILTNGKLQMPVTNKEDAAQILNSYISSFSENGYNFFVLSQWDGTQMQYLINDDYTKATIAMQTSFGSIVERHAVDLSYLTGMSDDFKTILTNGKLKVPSSVKDNLSSIIYNYLSAISEENEKYVFLSSDLSEDNSTVVISMKDKKNKLLEQHKVELSFLTEKSDEFKKELNKNGKLVFNSIKPTDENGMYFLFDLLFWENNEEKGYNIDNISEDFSSINLTINSGKVNQETHRVEVVYNYDEKTKQKLQGFVNNFPANIEYFYVKDLELINYMINNVKNNGSDNLDSYSGELKNAVNNNNIEYYVSNRAGEDGVFFTIRFGIAVFKYNGIIYYMDPFLGTKAENIIYVPSTTGNSREELIVAAQKRINEYLGKDDIVKVEYAGSAKDVAEAWTRKMYEETRKDWETWNPNLTFEEWKELYTSSPEDLIQIDGVGEDDDTFKVVVNVDGKEKSFNIIIKRDSSKMVTPSYKTTDMTTNIEISSESSTIPLDTLISAEKLTSGEEYDRIVKLLNLTDNLTFDLKLYSDSLEDYITKLSDGSFEVKIPISEDFEGKDLVVYYVDNDNKVTEHTVTVENGYAKFNTNHFSIYSLAVKNTTNNGNNQSGNNNNQNQENTVVNKNITTEKNPQTYDEIMTWIILGLISMSGIIGTIVYSKKQNI